MQLSIWDTITGTLGHYTGGPLFWSCLVGRQGKLLIQRDSGEAVRLNEEKEHLSQMLQLWPPSDCTCVILYHIKPFPKAPHRETLRNGDNKCYLKDPYFGLIWYKAVNTWHILKFSTFWFPVLTTINALMLF